MYININGRIEYKLNGSPYPLGVTQAKILSLAVSSLETDGVACTNVAISPILVKDPANPTRTGLAEYIVDARKATCVKQTIVGF